MRAILKILCLIGVLMGESFAVFADQPPQEVQLDIQRLDIPVSRSYVPQLFNVWKYEDHLSVDFLQKVREVEIEIMSDTDDIIYQVVVDGDICDNVKIDTEQMPSGKYTVQISIVHMFNQVYIGEFCK